MAGDDVTVESRVQAAEEEAAQAKLQLLTLQCVLSAKDKEMELLRARFAGADDSASEARTVELLQAQVSSLQKALALAQPQQPPAHQPVSAVPHTSGHGTGTHDSAHQPPGTPPHHQYQEPHREHSSIYQHVLQQHGPSQQHHFYQQQQPATHQGPMAHQTPSTSMTVAHCGSLAECAGLLTAALGLLHTHLAGTQPAAANSAGAPAAAVAAWAPAPAATCQEAAAPVPRAIPHAAVSAPAAAAATATAGAAVAADAAKSHTPAGAATAVSPRDLALAFHVHHMVQSPCVIRTGDGSKVEVVGGALLLGGLGTALAQAFLASGTAQGSHCGFESAGHAMLKLTGFGETSAEALNSEMQGDGTAALLPMAVTGSDRELLPAVVATGERELFLSARPCVAAPVLEFLGEVWAVVVPEQLRESTCSGRIRCQSNCGVALDEQDSKKCEPSQTQVTGQQQQQQQGLTCDGTPEKEICTSGCDTGGLGTAGRPGAVAPQHTADHGHGVDEPTVPVGAGRNSEHGGGTGTDEGQLSEAWCALIDAREQLMGTMGGSFGRVDNGSNLRYLRRLVARLGLDQLVFGSQLPCWRWLEQLLQLGQLQALQTPHHGAYPARTIEQQARVRARADGVGSGMPHGQQQMSSRSYGGPPDMGVHARQGWYGQERKGLAQAFPHSTASVPPGVPEHHPRAAVPQPDSGAFDMYRLMARLRDQD